jgi:hypothetical protein
MSDVRLLRTLCWTLVVAAIVAAVGQLLLTFGIWAGGPAELAPTADFVDRLLTFRSNDQEVFPVVLVGGVASVIVFVIVGLIGVVLRRRAEGGVITDVMATLLVIAAVVGVASQMLSIGVGEAATRTYCDCGYRTEEVIAQDYALSIGWTVTAWLMNAAFVLAGIGVAIAGRAVDVSASWRLLSYLIGIILIGATVVRVLTPVFLLPEVLFMLTDIAVGLTAGILVPIWAILLARGRPATELRTPSSVDAAG